METQNREQFQGLAVDAVVLSQRATLLTSYSSLVTGLITTAGTAVIIYVGGREVLVDALSMGSFIVFLSYLKMMQGNAGSLLRFYGGLKPLVASLDRIIQVLDTEGEVPEAREPKSLPIAAVSGWVWLEGSFSDTNWTASTPRSVSRGGAGGDCCDRWPDRGREKHIA